MAKKPTAPAPVKDGGLIYGLAYLHDGVNCYVGQVPPKLEGLAEQLDDMKGEGFQFFRASPEWYVVIRSTLREATETERRGYVANLALVFSPAHARELMENPARLASLKRVMGTLPHERLATLDQSAEWTAWPGEILDTAPLKRRPPSPLVKDLLRVVISNLLGERCYALVEGEDEDILAMLSLLPMKFRLAATFSSPYVGGQIGQVNNVTDARRKLNGVPAYRRYLVGQANAGSVQVSGRAEHLVTRLLELPAGLLEQLDDLARDEHELVELLELYERMEYAVRRCDRREVMGLSQSKEKQVTALLPLLNQESAARWSELSRPRQRGGTGHRSLEPEERRPSRLAQTSHIAVAGILVLALLAYLLIGTGVASPGDAVYFNIRFVGSDLVKLLLGVLLGFCGGYLCFRRK